MTLSRQRVAGVLFVAACAASGGIALAPDGVRGALYLALHGTLAACMLLAWTAREPVDGRALLLAGVLGRLSLIAVPPYTTHDVGRYLWDGQALLQGLDPYAIAPADMAAASSPWDFPVDSAGFVTIYPPLAMALFALSAAAGPVLGLWAWKLLTTIASITLLLAGRRLLDAHGAARHLALLALCPLLVLEAGVGAHVDVLAALCLVLALLAVARARDLRAGAWLGVAVLCKLTPLVALVPLLLFVEGARARRLLASCAVVVGAGYAAAMLGGLRPLGNLLTFFAKWRFGSPLWAPLDALTRDVPLAPALGLLGALVLLELTLRARRHGALLEALRRALGLPFVLSPAVFPWYLVVLAPVVALRPTAVSVGWLLTLPLTYEVIDRFDVDGAWQPAAWPLVVIALGWVAGAVLDRRARAAVAREAERARRDRDDPVARIDPAA
jgi:hypothetical protein